MFRTPKKATNEVEAAPPASPTKFTGTSQSGDATYDLVDLTQAPRSVRRSIERLESVGSISQHQNSPPPKTATLTSSKPAPRPKQTSDLLGRKQTSPPRKQPSPKKTVMTALSVKSASQSGKAAQKPKPDAQPPLPVRQLNSPGHESETQTISQVTVSASQKKYKNRVAEAKQCLLKAKINLGNSKNMSSVIKHEVTTSIERLYELVKEAEDDKSKGNLQEDEGEKIVELEETPGKLTQEGGDLSRIIAEHSSLLLENSKRMETLQEALEQQKIALEKTTYASVASTQPRRQTNEYSALHSVVVSSLDEEETGEEVLSKIREVVNARQGGIRVDRVRKAKDRKIIVGCRTEEDRDRVKERLKRAEKHLHVEEIKNKDPLLILKDVLQYNTDEDIIQALRSQNRNVFGNLDEQDDRIEVRYRRKTRNPYTCHIVIKVSPKIWNRVLDTGELHIDLQRIKVADQSPLVQCSLCLAYGHGRRYCKETVAKCSHCGGPHMKAECADWLANAQPSCCNCRSAKLDSTAHSAFSQECPIRRRWDALARASIAYC